MCIGYGCITNDRCGSGLAVSRPVTPSGGRVHVTPISFFPRSDRSKIKFYLTHFRFFLPVFFFFYFYNEEADCAVTVLPMLRIHAYITRPFSFSFPPIFRHSRSFFLLLLLFVGVIAYHLQMTTNSFLLIIRPSALY